MNKIKKHLSKIENRRLLENFFSLSILNFINYLFPLLLLPYLTKILGVEKFGLYAFSFAVIQYCNLIVNYGFDYSATKFVAINRNNTAKISNIFITTSSIRIILALICIILLILGVLFIKQLGNEYLLYIYGLGMILGQALTPI